MSRRKIAVFGGSFNPPHIGHQIAVLHAVSMLDIDTLVVAPAYVHADGKALAPFDARMDMVRRMVRPLTGSPKSIVVSYVEQDACEAGSGGTTAGMLKQLPLSHEGYAGAHITLILGDDIKQTIADWKGFDELAAMVKAGNLAFHFLDRIGPSSTQVRALYARPEGGGPEDKRLVPEDVRWYINNHGLYKT